ncbi:hypothetical protein MSAN_01039100 [Mycena sanguinolenta]|uniref:F-box domain-containing protein n=1 Tax=Mycena sanguinolenta TaxID=230812 RepID=A0A8H6YRF9_9AGAR|nr:hypothetical protein MSAN_01039100 [Mycena sanguinolenta]
MVAPFHTALLEQKERTKNSSRADIQRFIEQSELQIISLESQITALVELCDRERICIAALRHLHSPIHILPIELLVEIFELTFREYTHIKDVFRISQVCSDWRQVTRSTPQLWARPIHLDPRNNQDRRGSNLLHADDLKAWLLRSAPLAVPVSLVLDYESADHGISDEVLTTAPRWRSLHLDGPFYTSMPFLSRLAQAKLENLEELVPLRFSKDVDLAAFPSFTSVPRLKKLFMQIHSKALPILLPWAQLIDLTLVSDFLRLTLDILAQCTELTRATIHTTALPDPPSKTDAPASPSTTYAP